MPVDPDCDTGDCDDEPPDPEPGCNFAEDCITGAVRNFYSEGDPVADAVEILEDKSILYPDVVWIQRQYPEPLSQCTWLADWGTYVASDYVLLEEYSEAYPYPYLQFPGTLKGSGGLGGMSPDFTLGNTLNGSVYGQVSFGGPSLVNSIFNLYLYLNNGSTLIDNNESPFMVIQHGGIHRDGQCIYRARKFGPYANYAAFEAALAEFPAIEPYGTFEGWSAGQLPPFIVDGAYNMGQEDMEYAVSQIYPWEFEVIVPLPVEGFFEVDFPSGWFSGGLDGVNIKLSSISINSLNTGGPTQPSGASCPQLIGTFTLELTGQPSWLASGSLTSPGCEEVTVNTARTTIELYPEGVWYDGDLRSITKVPTNIPITLCAPLVGGYTNNGVLTFDYKGGVCSNTTTHTFASSPPQVYTDSETACTVLSSASVNNYDSSWAYFVPDMAVSPQTNHSLSVINGTWYIYREANTPYTITYWAGGYLDNPFRSIGPVSNPITIRGGTVTIGAPTATIFTNDCICFVTGANAGAYGSVPVSPGNTIPPEIIAQWLADDLAIVAGTCGVHDLGDPGFDETNQPPCFCQSTCYYKRNLAQNGYDLYNPNDYKKGCMKTEEEVLSGLSTAMPVLKPTPCVPEDCAGHVATWVGEPTGKKKSDGYYKVKWTLVDDCPGTCCTEPPKEPTRIKKSIMVETPCKCDCA